MVIQRDSLFHSYLERLHADLRTLEGGTVADYIPELAKAAPEQFGISFATIDGKVYSVGDSETEFTIQSVSKPFAYAGALARLGADEVLKKVGVEPTGEAFNSIVLDQKKNRPFNPMVNAGAIAVAALAPGETQAERVEGMRAHFTRFADRELSIDQAVYRSEAETGHRNRAIAYLMLNTAMIDRAPEDVLDLYFRQCALKVTTEDLALMGATLANDGVNPRTNDRVLQSEHVRDVLTLMMTCGMYDYAGEWSYEVGLPAKSGVSGAVLAILPGQLSVAIWSPPLDEIGNSIRGIAACQRISQDFGLHLFMNPAAVEDVIRRDVRADTQQSLRIRNPRDRDILQSEGHRIALVEVQGALYFGSAERMLRRLDSVTREADYLIFDFRRLGSIDSAARRFFSDFLSTSRAAGTDIAFAEIPHGRSDAAGVLAELAAENGVRVLPSVDSALETYEDILLEGLRQPFDFTRFSLDSIELFKGLDRAQLGFIETLVQPMQFEPQEVVLKKGDKGSMLFVVARGTVSVWVGEEGGAPTRVGCLGPGQFFGEVAALGGGARSADVIADERVVCYGLSANQIQAVGESHPQIMATILGNMAREFGNRIRRANLLIAALQ
jgi:glutaminase